MADREDMTEALASEGCPQCAPIIVALRQHNEELERRLAQLEARVAELGGPPKSGKGTGGSAAGPAKAKGPKKRPGRKAGRGRFSFRQAPRPEELSCAPLEVPLPACCEHCRGKLEELGQ